MSDPSTIPEAVGCFCNHCKHRGEHVVHQGYCPFCHHVVGVPIDLCPCLICAVHRPVLIPMGELMRRAGMSSHPTYAHVQEVPS